MTRIEELTSYFLKFISDKTHDRLKIANEYSRFIVAEAINHDVEFDWKLINAEILKRYKNSGLLFIKDNAWKIVNSL